MPADSEEKKVAGPRGKRNRKRVEIKGNVYSFIAKYDMSFFKDEIIKFIYDMRVVTTNQLCKIYGDRYSDRWIQSVLQSLYENHFLFRKFTLSNQKGSNDAMYFIDKVGALYLANEMRINIKDLKWSQQDNAIGPDALKHTIDITQIRTRFEEHGKKNETEVRSFKGERRLGRIKFRKGEQEFEFNPDAEIMLAHKGKLYLYLLEYDTGTESKGMIEDKVEKYEQFYSSGEFKEFYPIHPIVLIVANDIIRSHRLKMWIEKKRQMKEITYLFANLDDINKEPFGKIFDTYRSTEKVSLFYT